MKENIKLPLYYGASIEIFQRAEILRNNMTEAEKVLWNKLSNNQILGLKFRRQHPINQFIVDYYCHKLKLVIEIDGGIHLKKEVAERDKGREYMLKNFDLHILRFNNDSIINDIENVLLQLRETISILSAL